jgi:GNAT superfamily N-acetyltransferase
MIEPIYGITTGQPQDVPRLAAIELAAAKLLHGHAPQAVLDETTSEAGLLEAQIAGRLWVARAGGTPVGFAVVEMLARDIPHLAEIDVHPDHGRRGAGTALVRAVCEWSRRSGPPAITLTTFRAVPWNMPFYSRLGFEEVPTGQLRPEIKTVVANEASRGLDPLRRVVMRFGERAA